MFSLIRITEKNTKALMRRILNNHIALNVDKNRNRTLEEEDKELLFSTGGR